MIFTKNYNTDKKCQMCHDCGGLHFDESGNCTLEKCHLIPKDHKAVREFEIQIAKVSTELRKEAFRIAHKCETCPHREIFGHAIESAFEPAITIKCKLNKKPETCGWGG